MTEDIVVDEDFVQFAKHINEKTGLDLMSYKQAQVHRRLTRLRERRGFKTFMEFYQTMEQDPSLHQVFIDQLTINVTEFFRNPERWAKLREQVFPEILKRTQKVKCWSAACSTGEEPYSLVLSLADLLPLGNIEVHATDLDDKILAKAQAGRYSGLTLKNVAPDTLEQFFQRVNSEYVISSLIKERVRFSQQNLLADRFNTDYDLIVCRNVTIYFTEAAKAELYGKFAQALKPGGFLFVGGTEQVVRPEQYGLTPAGAYVYQKR